MTGHAIEGHAILVVHLAAALVAVCSVFGGSRSLEPRRGWAEPDLDRRPEFARTPLIKLSIE